MLDRFATALLRPAVHRLAQTMGRTGISANSIRYSRISTGSGAMRWATHARWTCRQRLMPASNHEGRTGDRPLYPEALRQPLRESGLPRAERSAQQDNVAGPQLGANSGTKFAHPLGSIDRERGHTVTDRTRRSIC